MKIGRESCLLLLGVRKNTPKSLRKGPLSLSLPSPVRKMIILQFPLLRLVGRRGKGESLRN
jgi:hypothetical protein